MDDTKTSTSAVWTDPANLTGKAKRPLREATLRLTKNDLTHKVDACIVGDVSLPLRVGKRWDVVAISEGVQWEIPAQVVQCKRMPGHGYRVQLTSTELGVFRGTKYVEMGQKHARFDAGYDPPLPVWPPERPPWWGFWKHA